MHVGLDRLKFTGPLANTPWEEITEQQFRNALKANGWKGVGHILQRLRQRGPGEGLMCPADLSRSLRDGHTAPEGQGRGRRYLRGGRAYLAYRASNRGWLAISFH